MKLVEGKGVSACAWNRLCVNKKNLFRVDSCSD